MKFIHSLFLAAAAVAVVTVGSTGAQAPVSLDTAGDYAILSKTGVSTTGNTSITGDLGVSPIDSTAVTGFSLTLHPSGAYATSPLVTGRIYAADYTSPTPSNLTTAISDMELAYTDAAGRSLPDAIELGAGNINGMILEPGLYKWGSGVQFTTEVTLSGCPDDVWIFQIAQDLIVGNGAMVHLTGGAQAANVFWQVAGEVTLGTTSHFEGILISQTAIHLNTGASVNGRLLAQTAVTLNANTVATPPEPPILEDRLLKADSISRAADGAVTLVFSVTPGHPLILQESTDLTNWATVSTTTPTTSPHVITRAASLSDPKRFYRAFYLCD